MAARRREDRDSDGLEPRVARALVVWLWVVTTVFLAVRELGLRLL